MAVKLAEGTQALPEALVAGAIRATPEAPAAEAAEGILATPVAHCDRPRTWGGLALLLSVAGCQVLGLPDPARAPLTEADRGLLREYLRQPEPKAFAFAPATGRGWYAWGYPRLDEARRAALSGCDALGSPCQIYAENNRVVWQGEAAARAGVPSPGATASAQGREPEIELPLDAEGKARFEGYKARPRPKAFAFAPATGQTWHSWGYANDPAENQQIALSKCESFGSPCLLLAIDDDIVWRPDASPTQPRFAEPITVEPLRGELTANTDARVRRLPTTASRQIGFIRNGQSVPVAGKVRGNDWYSVTLPDKTQGYVYGPLLEGQPAVVDTGGPEGDWQMIEALRRRAEAGDAEAQFELGNRYDHGYGIERDGYEARYWFRRAAEQRHALGAYHLGLAYELGDGVDVDLGEAVRWFEIGAEGGHDVSAQKLAKYRPMVQRDAGHGASINPSSSDPSAPARP